MSRDQEVWKVGDRCCAPRALTYAGRIVKVGELGTIKGITRTGDLLILWDEVSTESVELAMKLSEPFWMPSDMVRRSRGS